MKATFRHTRSPPITLEPYSTNPGRLPRLRKPSRFALRQLAAEVRLLLDRLGRFLVGGDDAGLGGTRLLGRGVGVAPLTLALSTVGAVLPLALRAVRRERLSLSLPLGCLPLTLALGGLSLLALTLPLLRHGAAQAPNPGDTENGGDDVRRRAPLQAMQHIAPFPFLGM